MPRYGQSTESMKADAAQLAAMASDRERYTKAVQENTAEVARNTAADRELAGAQQNLKANAVDLTAAVERETEALAAQRTQIAATASETQAAAAAYTDMAAAAERAAAVTRGVGAGGPVPRGGYAAVGRAERGVGAGETFARNLYANQGVQMMPAELQALQRLQRTWGSFGGGVNLPPTGYGGGGGRGRLMLPENTGTGFIGRVSGAPTIAGTRNVGTAQEGAAMAEARQRAEQLAAAEAKVNAVEAQARGTLASAGQGYRNAAIQMAALSDAESRHGALTTEWIQSLMRGETTLGDLGNQMTQTIAKFGGWVAAAGLVYGVFKVLDQVRTGAKDTSDAVANLSRFNLNNFNGDRAAQSFRDIAKESNSSIKEVGQAAGQFGTIFKNQNDVMESARASVIATKLDNISLADSYTGLTAAVIGFHEQAQGGGAVNQMLNEMNALQRFGGARIKDVLTGTGRAAGDYSLAGGSRQYLEALISTMTRTGGISGTSAATAIARSATRFIHTPQNQAQLAAMGVDPNQGYDAIIRQSLAVARRSSPNQRIQLATALGGPLQGSRAFAPLFNNVDYFSRQLDIVQHKSSDAATRDELGKMLAGVGQQAHGVGVELQNLGSSLSGTLQAPLTVVLDTMKLLTATVSVLASGFNSLPGPAKELLAAMVGIAAAQRVMGHFGVGPQGVSEYRSAMKGLRGGVGEMNRDIYSQSRRVTVAQQRHSIAQTNLAQFQSAPQYSQTRTQATRLTAEQRAALMEKATSEQQLTAQEERMVAYLRQQAVLKRQEVAAQDAVTAEQDALNFRQTERDVMRQQLQGGRAAKGPAARRQWVQEFQQGGGFVPSSVTRPVEGATNLPGAAAGAAGAVERGASEAEKSVNALGRLGQRTQRLAVGLGSYGRVGSLFGSTLTGVGAMAERVGTSTVAAEAESLSAGARIKEMATAERGLIAGFGVMDIALAALIFGLPEFSKFVNNWKKASDQAMNAPLHAPTDQALRQQSAAAHGAYGGVMIDLYANQLQQQITTETEMYQKGQITRGQMMQRLAVNLKEMAVSQNLSASQAEQLRAQIGEAQQTRRTAGGGAGLANLQNIQAYTNMMPNADKKTGALNDPIQAYVKQYEDMLRALGPATQQGAYAMQQLNQIGAALFLQTQQGADPSRFYQFLQQEPSNIKNAIDSHLQLHAALAKNAGELRQAYDQANAGYAQGDQWISNTRQVVVQQQRQDTTLQQSAQRQVAQATVALAQDPNNKGKQQAAKTAQDGLDAANRALASDAQMLEMLKQVGQESHLDTMARQIQNNENYVDALSQRLNAATSAFAAMNPSNAGAIDDRKIADAAQAMKAAQRLPSWDPKRQQAVQAYYEAVNGRVEDQLQQIQAQGQVGQAQAAATGDPVAQAQAAQASAQRAYNLASTNKSRLKPGEWEQIVATLIQAQTATADAIHQSAVDTIQANEQIAQAHDWNNTQAQAQDALRAAQQTLAAARNAKERQQALVGLAQAQSQADQAQAQLIQSQYTLAESRTTDPLKQDALKYRAALAAVHGAGGSNRNQALAAANQALQQWQQDKVNTREQNVQFQLQMGQITTAQAISDYQALLKMKGLSQSMRQQIQLQIHQWQTGGNTGGFDLRVGQQVKLPSLYDVRRAITAARPPNDGTLNNFETNVNLTISNTGADAFNNTIRALETALNTSIRSHLRSAGIRRRGRR